MNAFGFSPSAEQHAKKRCCMTPQVLSVPLSNGRRRAWRLDLDGCGEGKCGRKEACEAARGLEIADEMQANTSIWSLI
jgi:hypothetical protein